MDRHFSIILFTAMSTINWRQQ